MNKYEKKVTVYEFDEGFFVEVNYNKDLNEFHMCNRNYGTKMHMFSVPDYNGMTEEEFVLNNVDNYINTYMEAYGDDFGC